MCALGYSHLELAIAALYTTSVQVSILLVCKTLLQISDAKTKPLGQSILAWGSHMCVCNINVPFCWFAEFYNFSCSYMYDIKITGTRIDLEIAVTRFIQPSHRHLGIETMQSDKLSGTPVADLLPV